MVGPTQFYNVDVVAEHFKSKKFEAQKMTGIRGEVNLLVVSRRGKAAMKFIVRNGAIRVKHLLAVVKDYAAGR